MKCGKLLPATSMTSAPKIGDLRKLERVLTKTIAQCTGTTAPKCPVLDILDVQRSK